jgi:hypothetical protein
MWFLRGDNTDRELLSLNAKCLVGLRPQALLNRRNQALEVTKLVSIVFYDSNFLSPVTNDSRSPNEICAIRT